VIKQTLTVIALVGASTVLATGAASAAPTPAPAAPAVSAAAVSAPGDDGQESRGFVENVLSILLGTEPDVRQSAGDVVSSGEGLANNLYGRLTGYYPYPRD
jgi:hypothetical protein